MAASTGIVGASVVTLGLLTYPVLVKNGYSSSVAAGTICVRTLGQIIPPSLVLILLADVLSSSYQQANLTWVFLILKQ